MATLIERSEWVTPVYRIERGDPLMGGEYGINNKPAQQLACRTRFLLDLLLTEHKRNGQHILTEAQVAAAAGIVESKLNLDVPTQQLYDNIAQANAILALIIANLDAVENLEKSKYRAMYQALMLTWRYGFPRFAFDMFTQNFTFSDNFKPVPIIETIAGDDSIDVVNSATIEPEEDYILWDKANNACYPVRVKKVLTNKRVILYHDEAITRYATGVLTRMAWELQDATAIAKAGSMYVTRELDLLKGLDRGTLVIAHLEPASFYVEYRTDISDWQPLALIDSDYSQSIGLYRSVYSTPGGTFRLRITAKTNALVTHLALMSDTVAYLNTTVRTPEVVDNDFSIVRFGAIYGATHRSTVFQLSENTDFTSDNFELTFGPNESPLPVWDYKNKVLNSYQMLLHQGVYWRARYTASDGYKSRWSNIGYYIREN